MKKAVETPKTPPPSFPGDAWRLSYKGKVRFFANKTLSDSGFERAGAWVHVDVLAELPDGNVLGVSLEEPVRFFVSPKNFGLLCGFAVAAGGMPLDHLREYAAENKKIFGLCRVSQYKRPPAALHEGLLKYLKAML